MNKNLTREISRMAKEDQKMRKSAYKTGEWDSSIDRKNTERMKKIVKEYGWPTIPLVGKKTSQNAWLLVQHADHDVKFQKRCLKLLKNLYKRNPNSINPANIAYLTDRVLINEGRKQLFGTQFYKNKNKMVPRPIRDIKNIEKRRREYHLTAFRDSLYIGLNYSPCIKKILL